jgi:hypothetical protein
MIDRPDWPTLILPSRSRYAAILPPSHSRHTPHPRHEVSGFPHASSSDKEPERQWRFKSCHRALVPHSCFNDLSASAVHTPARTVVGLMLETKLSHHLLRHSFGVRPGTNAAIAFQFLPPCSRTPSFNLLSVQWDRNQSDRTPSFKFLSVQWDRNQNEASF